MLTRFVALQMLTQYCVEIREPCPAAGVRAAALASGPGAAAGDSPKAAKPVRRLGAAAAGAAPLLRARAEAAAIESSKKSLVGFEVS